MKLSNMDIPLRCCGDLGSRLAGERNERRRYRDCVETAGGVAPGGEYVVAGDARQPHERPRNEASKTTLVKN